MSDNENSVDCVDLEAPEMAMKAENVLSGLPPMRAVKSKVARKKKPAMKQMTLKKGLVNMKEKNFQGYDLDQCVEVPEYNKFVYIPKRYGGHSRKLFPYGIPPCHGMWYCKHCHLMPCITVEYHLEVEKAIPDDLLQTGEEELVPILRRAYRKAVMKQCGKKFMTKLMPHDNQLPQCAMEKSVLIAKRENGGYDSLLDDVGARPSATMATATKADM